MTSSPEQYVHAYHQLPFFYLHKALAPQISEALLDRPRSIRANALLRVVPIGVSLNGPVIWNDVRTVLAAIELEMKVVLEKRSVAFWLHLYRRLGVSLTPTHESLTGPRTVALVRGIAELAIMKFGSLALNNDLALTSQIHVDRILGGLLRKAIKDAFPKRFSAVYRSYGRMLRASPAQWVLQNFDEGDFTAIYFIEGLSYQYWRIMALLRVIGKGVNVTFNASGNWEYLISKEVESLFHSIDQRTEQEGFNSSLIGV
jgi:hypothetical protein